MGFGNGQKMKIFKYIFITLKVLIVFIPSLIAMKWLSDRNLSPTITNVPYMAIGIVVSLIALTTCISVLIYSIKGLIKGLRFKKERGLWKILTFIFRLAMFLLGMAIVAALATWLYFMITNGFIPKENTDWIKNAADFSLFYISGINKAEMIQLGYKDFNQELLLISFIFTVIWSIAGIAFEIIKRILRGYKTA